MFSSLLVFALLFAGSVFCNDVEEEDDETRFAMNYLTKYGYLSRTTSGNHDKATAIKNFQKFFGVEVTGELNEVTFNEMKKPRCGDPDVGIDGGRKKRYITTNGKLLKTSLKYHIEYGKDIIRSVQDRIFSAAFTWWSIISSYKLQFNQTKDFNQADIKISFGTGKNHEGPGDRMKCTDPFDGHGGVLAHADSPGEAIHFDEDENWTEGKSSGIGKWRKKSLFPTAIHEIGHALGLGHSNVKGSIMWPEAKDKFKLPGKEERDAIEYLYGDGTCEDRNTFCADIVAFCDFPNVKLECRRTCGEC